MSNTNLADRSLDGTGESPASQPASDANGLFTDTSTDTSLLSFRLNALCCYFFSLFRTMTMSFKSKAAVFFGVVEP